MADEVTMVTPTLSPEQTTALGLRLGNAFETYKKDRLETEYQWLRNLRQFRGMYDPDILAKIAKDRSTAYPKITRNKVIGTVARLMEMLFPQTEKNWGIAASPLPDLSESDLQTVLDQLVEELKRDPTSDEVETGVKSLADAKAKRMSTEMEDQLDEIEYITLARRVIFSAVLYSVGILKGPQVVKKKSRIWTKDAMGKLKATTIDKFAPVYEFVSCWDWYPDLSAKTFKSGDGSYQRHVMSRNQVAELAKRPDFMADRVTAWLSSNASGNYKELHWEQELRTKGDRKNLTDLTGRKYELWEWWGFVSGHDLKAVGVPVKDAELASQFEANYWGLGNHIIKAKINPYDYKIRPYHIFVYEEDDINLLGNGVPQVMRDSQLAICEAARMMLDNGSVVCGPILEMNTERLVPGQSLSIHAFKTFLRDDTGAESQMPAVREIKVESHIAELQSIINLFMSIADTETALPPAALGDTSQGGSEAMRTQGNLSMLLGAAALPIRDVVRNFDTFTTSFISSLYYWNMQFGTEEAIKGDFAVIARGSTSLIAKEVRSVHLDQFAATLTAEERMYLSTEKILIARMEARDLPKELLEDPAVVKTKLAEQARNAQQAAAQQTRMAEAEIKKMVAGAFKDFALAIKAQAGANAETFTALVEGVERVAGNRTGEGAGASSGGASSS